jgi:hypothetical protein
MLGCAQIPQESVSLSMEIGKGVISIHESNVRFVNWFFDAKIEQVNSLEKEALDNFFSKIAEATEKPGAPPLKKDNLYKIKSYIDQIHAKGNDYRSALNTSRTEILRNLENDYRVLINANGSITGLLQSAVAVDEAKTTSYDKLKDLTHDKIDLTEIEQIIDDGISKFGDKSAKGTDILEKIQKQIDKK